jgi:bilin biosynthesis protein
MTTDSLFEQLKHPNPHLRERAMQELAESRDENTIPRLMGILGEEDIVYRRAAVKALGVIGPEAVPSLVESLLNSDNATIRGSCAKALAQVALNYPDVPFPTEGMQGLKIALNDPNPVVHIASVMALGEIGSPALDILIESLKTTDNVALAVAITNALGSIGDNRAVEVLTTFANDESADSYVRESATSALPRLEQVSQYQAARQERSH